MLPHSINGIRQDLPPAAPRAPRGFTLIELLVVIAIISILAAMLLCLMQVDHAGDENKKQKAGWKMQALLPTSFHPASCEILYDQPANPMQDHTA